MKQSDIVTLLEIKLNQFRTEFLNDQKTTLADIKAEMLQFREWFDASAKKLDGVKQEVDAMKEESKQYRSNLKKEFSQMVNNANKLFISRVSNEQEIQELLAKASGNSTATVRVLKSFPSKSSSQSGGKLINAIVWVDPVTKELALSGKKNLKGDSKFGGSYINRALTKEQRMEEAAFRSANSPASQGNSPPAPTTNSKRKRAAKPNQMNKKDKVGKKALPALEEQSNLQLQVTDQHNDFSFAPDVDRIESQYLDSGNGAKNLVLPPLEANHQ